MWALLLPRQPLAHLRHVPLVLVTRPIARVSPTQSEPKSLVFRFDLRRSDGADAPASGVEADFGSVHVWVECAAHFFEQAVLGSLVRVHEGSPQGAEPGQIADLRARLELLRGCSVGTVPPRARLWS